MLFSSITFLCYFLPVVLVLYYLFRWNRGIKNILLLAASLFFYAWGEPAFVVVMLGCILGDYLLALLIERFRSKGNGAKRIVFLAIVLHIGLLFVFKYLDFAIQNLNQTTGSHLTEKGIMVPVGISFFTLRAISYLVDVYRQQTKAQKNLFHLALYLAFFPQVAAGPIVRYNAMEEQFINRKETMDKFSVGVCRLIAGMGKKVLLADQLAIVADGIFQNYQQGGCPVTLAWLGAIAYMLQIFYDFSGYSDMAIGLGLMFGFKLDENFNYPYISKSVSEFWRRWHISLGNWLREYIYFTLGGSNVKNMDVVLRNMLVVWVVTGIWHGAEWTFVIWGLFHFALMVFERFVDMENWEKAGLLRRIYTMLAVLIGWVIFRSENLICAGNYLRCMFGFGGAGIFSDYTLMYLKEFGMFFLAGIIFCIPMGKRMNYLIAQKRIGKLPLSWMNLLYPVVMMGILIISFIYLVKGNSAPFIYFNF